MKKIAIITDSTSGIKKDNNENIIVIPLSFLFGEDVFLDGIDLDSHGFFEVAEKYFKEQNIFPKTSQPSIGETIAVFEKTLQEYDEIIYITISSKMSGTYQSGVLGASEFDGRVHVIDSRTTSAMQADLTRYALKLVNKGMSTAEIVEKIEAVKGRSEVYFVVNSLEHLHRSGRISKMSMQLGSFLKLKPLLTVIDGSVVVSEKIRTIKKAHAAMFEKALAADVKENSIVTVLCGKRDEYSDGINQKIMDIFQGKDIKIFDISPVVGVNTGPNIVGISITNYED